MEHIFSEILAIKSEFTNISRLYEEEAKIRADTLSKIEGLKHDHTQLRHSIPQAIRDTAALELVVRKLEEKLASRQDELFMLNEHLRERRTELKRELGLVEEIRNFALNLPDCKHYEVQMELMVKECELLEVELCQVDGRIEFAEARLKVKNDLACRFRELQEEVLDLKIIMEEKHERERAPIGGNGCDWRKRSLEIDEDRRLWHESGVPAGVVENGICLSRETNEKDKKILKNNTDSNFLFGAGECFDGATVERESPYGIGGGGYVSSPDFIDYSPRDLAASFKEEFTDNKGNRRSQCLSNPTPKVFTYNISHNTNGPYKYRSIPKFDDN